MCGPKPLARWPTATPPLAHQSLQNALKDRSVAVREAAEQSLRKLSAEGRMTTAGPLTTALEDFEDSPLFDQLPADAAMSERKVRA